MKNDKKNLFCGSCTTLNVSSVNEQKALMNKDLFRNRRSVYIVHITMQEIIQI